jgi:hypothetical protein
MVRFQGEAWGVLLNILSATISDFSSPFIHIHNYVVENISPSIAKIQNSANMETRLCDCNLLLALVF